MQSQWIRRSTLKHNNSRKRSEPTSRRAKSRVPVQRDTKEVLAALWTILLDDSERLFHNHHASVASLDCCSPSLRNAVRLPSGIDVHLHRNTRNGWEGWKSDGTGTPQATNFPDNGAQLTYADQLTYDIELLQTAH